MRQSRCPFGHTYHNCAPAQRGIFCIVVQFASDSVALCWLVYTKCSMLLLTIPLHNIGIVLQRMQHNFPKIVYHSVNLLPRHFAALIYSIHSHKNALIGSVFINVMVIQSADIRQFQVRQFLKEPCSSVIFYLKQTLANHAPGLTKVLTN
jgi:hypothetical protein